ncbi:DNA helicase [Salmonella phage 19]|nr:DNA helicase [Salmonella phage 19]
MELLTNIANRLTNCESAMYVFCKSASVNPRRQLPLQSGDE